ncbi:MAG TPA: ScbA/BarX family gamma-butyrolactone biosynthesis protein [Pseudonocardiaceae bacterium]|jgi:hypothetical protein|nr:ScbA/BarX family gamma-butyrolactone biosynthesis protein [Pseudonocardiaceae bacterium]
MTIGAPPVLMDNRLPDLAFDRTVPRDPVHRRALSELFLTDSKQVDQQLFVAAAQLPPSHSYYTDHALGQDRLDPLLLLECCRQAETYAVHAHFGLPRNTKFVLQKWSLRLLDPNAARRVRGPAELLIAAHVRDPRWRGDQLRGLRYEMDLTLAGSPVGVVGMEVSYLPEEFYTVLRRRGHTSPPPDSDSFRAGPPTSSVPAAGVARVSQHNVLLCDAVTSDQEVRATVRVAGEHASLFDHPQDHLPGMTLMEAGRQAALLAVTEFTGVAAVDAVLGGMRMAFDNYVELDQPVTVSAHRPEPGSAVVPVTVEQRGATAAAGWFHLTGPDAGTAPTDGVSCG